MAEPTANLGLSTINRSTEATSTLVGTWIDSMNDVNSGNMTVIDTAIGKILNEGAVLKNEIAGNGTTRVFTIKHNRNTLSPAVSVFSGVSNSEIFPNVVTLDNNRVNIEFLTPPPANAKYFITIN